MNKMKLLLVIFINIIFISCSEDSSTEPKLTFFDIQGENGFVGKVNGTNAFISILAGENLAVAYVCNGEEQISEWFNQEIIDPTELNLSNSNGAQITARFEENTFVGEYILSSGIKYSFQATPSSEESAGIYRVMGEEAEIDKVEAGWILNSTGQEKGALRINSLFQKTVILPQTNAAINNKSYPVFRFLVKAPSPAGPIPIPYPNIDKLDTVKNNFLQKMRNEWIEKANNSYTSNY